MTNWREHWNRFPSQVDQTDYLTQVGHTFGGRPYNDEVFHQMIESIGRALALGRQDHLLDLCCGNGVITARLAERCASVVGIDFSRPLLEIANRAHRPDNVRYLVMDVTTLDEWATSEMRPFSKVMMYGSLQHLDRGQLPRLLQLISRISIDAPRVLLGGIPNWHHRARFLDSPARVVTYFWRRLLGRDRIGRWWRPEEIEAICTRLGLTCTIDSQSQDRPGGHYRFDAIITKETG